jgi:RHS repeat-associated protein
MSVVPLTLADASFYGDSAAGNSTRASSFSADGQLVAFESDAGNLAAGDFNGLSDVFVRNLSTGQVTLVSASFNGQSGTGASSNPILSADGRFVLFESLANDLVAGDSNGALRDVFVRDLQTGTTERINVNTTGGSSNNHATVQFISPDGRLVGFNSNATNLVNTTTGNIQNLFVRDRQTGTTSLITINFDGTQGGNGPSPAFGRAQLNPDGRFIAFDSSATNLVSNDVNGVFPDVFLHDLQTGTNTLVSLNLAGTGSGNSQSINPVFDPTGRYIAFASKARDLVAGNPLADQVYIRDLLTGTTELVSVNNTFDGETPRQSIAPYFTFSPDGRYLAYEGLITESLIQVYARDLVNDVTLLVSSNLDGAHLASGVSARPAFRADSQRIFFSSSATNLVAGVTAGTQQVYDRNLNTNTTALVSRQLNSSPGNLASVLPIVSPDGQTVLFQSASTGLVTGDNNASQDLFQFNVDSGVISLASTRNQTLPLSYTSRTAEVTQRVPTDISADGRYVVYTSEARDLVDTPTAGRNVFRTDLVTGTNELVSIDASGLSGGQAGAGALGNPAISADGRYVVFDSNVSTLVNGLVFAPGIFGVRGIFVRDMVAGTTRALNLNQLGQVAGNSGDRYAISPNGRYVAFATVQSLLASDTNSASDVYVYDLQSNSLSLVSRTTGGAAGNNFSTILGNSGVGTPQDIFSDDGRFLVFSSRATDLVAAGGASDALYVRDLQSGTTTLVSVAADGTPRAASGESLSADGTRVAFITQSSLLAADGDSQFDVYVRNISSSSTTLVTAAEPFGAASPLISRDGTSVLYTATGIGIQLKLFHLGTQSTRTIHTGNDPDYFAALSADGKFVAFLNNDGALASGDNNGVSDVFLYDYDAQTTAQLSRNQSGTAAGNRGVAVAQLFISASGNRVIFASDSFDLTPGDFNGNRDIFAFTQSAGQGSLGGKLYIDNDQNGSFGAGDTPLAGWFVFLDDGDNLFEPGEPQVFSDSNGDYVFSGLEAGTYNLLVESRDGFNMLLPLDGFYSIDLGAGESIVGLEFTFQADQADLAVGSIGFPTSIQAGESITINWVVNNQGAFDAPGNWQDAVYLSADAILDADDLLLGTAAHVGGLLAGNNYLGQLTINLPGVLPGNYYVLVESDRRAQVTQATRDNDLAASSATLAVDVAPLLLDTPASDLFITGGDRHYYRITPPADRSLEISLDSLATDGVTAIYVSRNRVPSAGDFEFRADTLSADQKLVIPRTVVDTTYYILVEGRAGNAAFSNYTLLATLPGLTVAQVSPSTGGNTGQFTVRIDGTDFTPDALVEISQGLTTLTAIAVDFRDPSLLYATFDLSGQVVGTYDVRVNTGSDLEVAVGAFQVVPGQALPLEYKLVTPTYLRPGRQVPVVVEVTNPGNVDVPAPLLGLQANNAFFRFSDQTGLGTDNFSFLAISPDGPAGVLRAGQTVRIVVTFTPFDLDGAPVPVNLLEPTALDQIIDWSGLKASQRPIFVSNEAWDVIWDRFVSQVGATNGEYQAALARAATYLGQLGVYTSDPGRLLTLLLKQADNSLFLSQIDSATDISVDAPGLTLSLTRMNSRTVSGAYRFGALGRGWSHQWEIVAAQDDLSNVTIQYGGETRTFLRQPNGTYVGLTGDIAQLTFVGGAFRLREVDGLVQQFRTDGFIDYIEDRNGNRITASYNASLQLSALTHSSGQILNLTYNAQGRLSQVTSSNGEIVTYTYDASGQHLASATNARGTLNYTYQTGISPATEHALKSIQFQNGLQSTFEYSTDGRLIAQQYAEGSQLVTYSYGPYGEVTITDPSGATRTYWLNDFGLPEQVRDQAGHIDRFDYDSNQRLASYTNPDGATEYYTFCACGSLLNMIDAQGNRIDANYDPLYRQITSFTDTNGTQTNYEQDDRGNITVIHHPDGSVDQFEYDAVGNVIGLTDRAGETLQYTYDAAGRVLTKSGGGISQSFTYDARGNLLTATDASGTIAMQYDAQDRIIRVDYPNGRFLIYSYNAIGQPLTINQNGFVVNYTYDSLSRLTDVTDGSANVLAHYEYDDFGRLALEVAGNGNRTTYLYNDHDRISRITHTNAANVVLSFFEYAYNEVDLVASVTTLEGTTTYGYDGIGQLTSVVLPTGRTITYEYDQDGNRVRVVDNGVETLYSANGLNQYTSVGPATYTYDARGNIRTRTDAGGTTTYTFDTLDQLIEVDGPAGHFVYEYDALGNRVAQTTNGVRREFLVDLANMGDLVAEFDDQGQAISNFAYGFGLVGQFQGSDAYYFDFDALGSTHGVTNSSGAYVNQYSYLPFGETTTLSESIETPFQFVGQFGVQSRGDGLHAMGFRNYDSSTGQFVSEDPIRFAGGDANLRRYVGNSPTNAIDPLGLSDNGYTFKPGEFDESKMKARMCSPQGKGFNVSEVSLQEFREELYERGLRAWADSDAAAAGRAELKQNIAAQKNMLKIQLPINRVNSEAMERIGNALTRTRTVVTGAGKLLGAACPAADALGGYFLAGSVWKAITNEIELSNLSIMLGAWDPNDIVGPVGVGDSQYTTSDQPYSYTIHFENDPNLATAPAQEVFVTHQLDTDLDWSSFELGDVGFGSGVIDVPAGLQVYTTQFNYQNQDGSPLLVHFSAALDLQTGIVTWVFRSIDPETGQLPDGVFDGFLPVNDETGRGEGFIDFLVNPQSGLATGTTIDAQASIVFDINDPILTNTFTNTIDNGVPASSVDALPQVTDTRTFTVSWSGTDDGNGIPGVGIAFYDVYVSDNGGAYTLWQSQTVATSADFTGQNFHIYSFYSVATDLLGQREDDPTEPDTTTELGFEEVVSVVGGVAIVRGTSDNDIVFVRGGATLDIDFNGDVYSLDPSEIHTLRVELGSGFDRVHLITLDQMPALIQLDGGDDDDIIRIVLGEVPLNPAASDQRVVQVIGGSGTDQLIVDGSTRLGDEVAFLYPILITGWAFHGNIYYNDFTQDIESLQFDLGAGNDIVGIAGLSVPTTLTGGAGHEYLTVQPGFAPLLTYSPGEGYDWLSFVSFGEVNDQVLVRPDSIRWGGTQVNYENLDVLDINTYGGDDRIILTHQNSIENLPGIIRVAGGTNASPEQPERDRVVILGSAEDDSFGITDYFADLPGRYQLTQIETLAILGMDGNDFVNNGSSVFTFIDGGAGNDFLIGGRATDVLFGADGVDTLFGGPGADFLLPDHDGDFNAYGLSGERVNGGQGFDSYYRLGEDTIQLCEYALTDEDLADLLPDPEVGEMLALLDLPAGI